jgi:hypothetical protein
MENKKKGQFAVSNSKKAWETIQELILDDENMTLEELDLELKEYGIDPQDTVRRIFELAQRVSTNPQSGGRVSPLVSDILTQLAGKYYNLDNSAVDDAVVRRRRPHTSSINNRRSAVDTKAACATVQSFHRNFTEESANDQAIREKNESRLQEKAEKLKRKKPARKK